MRGRDVRHRLGIRHGSAPTAEASASRRTRCGRFLLLHIASQNKIGLFDANSADIPHYFPVQADTVFTAGMNKLITWSPSAGEVTRWDLLTRQKEISVPLTMPGKVTAFCMGSASDGPLVACTEQQFRLLEIDGFTALDIPDDERGQPIGQLANNNYWAGGAGRVCGRSGRLGMPNGVSTLVLDTERTKLTYQHQATFYVVPGPDGKHIEGISDGTDGPSDPTGRLAGHRAVVARQPHPRSGRSEAGREAAPVMKNSAELMAFVNQRTWSPATTMTFASCGLVRSSDFAFFSRLLRAG